MLRGLNAASKPRAPRCAISEKGRGTSSRSTIGTAGGDFRLGEMTLRTINALEETARDDDSRAKGVDLVAASEHMDDGVPFSLRTQLDSWEGVFRETVTNNRSLAIGCQMLMQHTRDMCAHEPQPNLIMLVSALMVLAHFMPLFGPYVELMKSIVAEIAQALYVSSSSFIGQSKSADTYAQRTFFASFFDVLRSFALHRARNKTLISRYNLQRSVLQKTSHWEHIVVRSIFCSWRGTVKIEKLRLARHLRIIQTLTHCTLVREALVRWKRLGGRRSLGSLKQQSAEALEKLALAQASNKAAHVTLHHVEQALLVVHVEHSNLCRDVEGLVQKKTKIEKQLAEAVELYNAHIDAWKEAVRGLFGDNRSIEIDSTPPDWMTEDVKKRRMKNFESLTIVDTAATFRQRSNIRETSVPMSVVAGFLSDLVPEVSRRLTVPGTADDEKVLAISRHLFGCGVPLHISTADLIKGDFSKVLGFSQMVKYLCGGGHCGAFLTELISPVPYNSSVQSFGKGEAQAMVRDIEVGMKALSHARDARIVVDDMYRTEVAIGQALDWFRAASRLYATLSAFDDRETKFIVESTLCESIFAARGDLQLMLGLTYPRQGISSAMELLQFAATTGEMTGLQGGDVLACLESCISLTPMQTVSVDVASAEMKRVVKPFRLHLIGMMRSCSASLVGDSMAASASAIRTNAEWSAFSKRKLCPERSALFFAAHPTVAALIGPESIAQYVDAVRMAHGYEAAISFNMFVEFMLLVAQHCDPSPFETNAWKLKSLLIMLKDG
jgi:hypothetical protein